MKQLFAVCLMLLTVALCAQQASAQGEMAAANPIYFGARAGLSLANASLTPDLPAGISKGSRTGLAAGAIAEFGVAPNFFIDAEALYVQGGFKATASGAEATAKFDFISIPISAKYKFMIENSNVKPFIFGGGNVGFDLKAEIESGGTTQDVKDSTESVDFGVHFGAGIEIEASPGVNIMLDGRYQLGLKDIDKTSGGEAKAQNILIMAGVSFKVN
ncbi:MAG: PorT family protein [Ignavibacteria bacterium]|nr:PorT family protein [Ignavibacteria bacterium]